MQGRWPRLALTLFFVLLLAIPVVLSRLSNHSEGPVDTAAALSRYGFYFQEVSKASGIDFVHQAPKLDPALNHIMPQVAAMGAAVSIVDFDRDGWPDIYVTNSGEGSLNHLYRNRHDGTFEDVAPQMGIADVNKPGTGVSMGAVWGDYDNDGYEDLLLYKWGKAELYHNDHGKGFTRVTDRAGLPSWANINSAVWLDYDGDGHLDLFLGGYYSEDIDLWHLKTTRIMPKSFEYAENGGRKWLLRGRGDGTFEDVTEKVGLNSHRWALAAAAADLRGTGYPDLVVANDYGVSEYWENDGGKRFKDVGKSVGIGARPKSGMNVSFGDILNTGNPAIYITNISENGALIQGNNLWVPHEGSSPAKPLYDNMAEAMGVEMGGWSFGAQFGDLNNDGHLDIFLTDGYVSGSKSKSYWYDFAKVAGGNSSIISDAKNWPPMGDMSLSGYQQKHVWLNDGAGRFIDVAAMVGVTDTHDGRSVAMADLWNRGVLDVVVANQRGPLRLYKNTADPANAWIEFNLEGTRSNRSAIGAGVTVFWNGQKQTQFVMGGSGFCAENDRRLHFGLGKTPQIEKVVIRWPSGTVQTLPAPEINKLHLLKEPA
ncbi:MAG: CRTAC1 family protein [Armatimonadota bacterium]|nr:CRTAC1 family protein [Armatimonadota bacterium]